VEGSWQHVYNKNNEGLITPPFNPESPGLKQLLCPGLHTEWCNTSAGKTVYNYKLFGGIKMFFLFN